MASDRPVRAWLLDGLIAGSGLGFGTPLTLVATITALRTSVSVSPELFIVCATAGGVVGSLAGGLAWGLHHLGPRIAMAAGPLVAFLCGVSVLWLLQTWDGQSLLRLPFAVWLGVASFAVFGVAPPWLAYFAVLNRGRSPRVIAALIPVWGAGVFSLVLLAAIAAERGGLWKP